MTSPAVLFDLDGTLLDTALDFQTAINRLLKEEGKAALPIERIRACVTHGSLGLVTSVFGIHKEHTDFPRLQKGLLAHYKNCLTDRTALFSGLQSGMKLLSEHDIPWGIVTNKPSEYAVPIVKKLLSNTQVLICPDHVKQAKPDPEGMLLACEKMGVDPKSTYYLGDHQRDEQGEHRTWGADYSIDLPEDMAPLFREILF